MDPLSVLLFLVLFALSAFFSGSEIAFMSLPTHKVQGLIKQGRHGAKAIKFLKDNTQKLLITILLGNNLVNTFAAALATQISIGLAEASGFEASIAIGISTGVITLLILLFGEIFPKTVATRYAESISLFVAPLYIFLMKVLYPIVWIVDRLMKSIQPSGQVYQHITDEEIEAFIEQGHKAGVFQTGEYEKIRNMLDFYEVSAQSIMTPRVDLDALEDNVTVDDAIEQMLYFSHSRILVYNNTIDDIYGVVTLRDLLAFKKKKKGAMPLHKISLKSVMKIPLTNPIHKVLDLFRKNRHHMAVVIDEYGGVAGVLTLEDIVEHVFGDIQDETDNEKTTLMQKGQDLAVQGFIVMDELLDHLGLDFVHVGISEDTFGGETLSYFVTSFLERFPHENEVINLPVYGDDIQWRKMQLIIKSVADDTVGEVVVILK